VYKVLGLHRYQNRLFMELEDIGGTSLDRTISSAMEIGLFLEQAIPIAKNLKEVHHQNILHRDIHPANIVWNEKTGACQLIDFGLASSLSRQLAKATPPEHLEGSLTTLSPEQTGRTNRAVDQRSEIYSLGALFYWLLTGAFPFTYPDPLSLVHAHLAKTPQEPTVIRPEIPDMLSHMIMKMLAKAPEDRYQSVGGVLYDLQCIQKQWEVSSRVVAPFQLATEDMPIQFIIPETLYGREPDLAQLSQAWHRVKSGSVALVLIAGEPGIGKSALANGFRDVVIGDQGRFFSGKFDRLKNHMPHAVLVQIYRQLVQDILAEGDHRITWWRKRLLGAVGAIGAIAIQAIPELEYILGPQPAVPDLPPEQSRNRFFRVMGNLTTRFFRCGKSVGSLSGRPSMV
jgi:serine/threonine protein kinase